MNIGNDGSFKSYPKTDRQSGRKKTYKIRSRKITPTNGINTHLKQSFGYQSQPQMFEDMWEKALKEGKGKVICPFTNINLTAYAERDMSFYLSCFAHILPKGKYPMWKLNPENVRIVAPSFHTLVDQGRFSERAKYPEYKFSMWDKLVEDKKIEYAEFIKLNN